MGLSGESVMANVNANSANSQISKEQEQQADPLSRRHTYTHFCMPGSPYSCVKALPKPISSPPISSTGPSESQSRAWIQPSYGIDKEGLFGWSDSRSGWSLDEMQRSKAEIAHIPQPAVTETGSRVQPRPAPSKPD
ncbi:hypothetical protein MHYP_G00182040 [Metynnis hypsauchen]